MSITAACLRLAASFSSRKRDGSGGAGLPAAQLQEVEAQVRPILAELESLRKDTLRRIDLRAAWMVPAGCAGGFVAGMILNSDSPAFGAITWAVFGAFAGWASAFTSLNNAYRRAYKTRIIPHLTARFGELTYRPAVEPDLERLAKFGLIPSFGKKKVEDEILGAYRGVPVHIVEANLETGGKNSRVVFNGLLAELAFPGRFAGLTVAAKDGGVLGNAIGRFVQASGLERVRLEDPNFESRYQVYSNDQVSARSLLTPAVMERLLELERLTEGAPPRLVAEQGTLRVALEKDRTEDLFEPPSIANELGGGDALLVLSAEIGSVLKLVDAVLDLTPLHVPLRRPA